ncbi:MAG: hypothetical protein OXN26_19850 [Gammaproteobacteria bacterium]|nr:hypothetical protein [Gammaproteobacteria bacterium]
MVKTVLAKAGMKIHTALATLGWLSFLVSYLMQDLTSVIFLQAIARVLP